ncbi:unnamed protein product [Phytophthora fragariaefolia]|uniref:Unnamed protein product n=1 Tax=Phytophthora fragariaefolia TaxID=1490495 RepID=A0A9W7CRA3_9STRA|nr:unnamed protein product [Phytophthora fragariaefolia]
MDCPDASSALRVAPADLASPAASSPASSSAGEEPSEKLPPPAPVLKPLDPASDEDAATGGAHGLAGAFGQEVRTLRGLLLETKVDVSKWLHCLVSNRLEKYQPTIVKAKTSATAGLGLFRVGFFSFQVRVGDLESGFWVVFLGLTTAASRMKEGSTQGWSMLKTKLAAAGPVAERIHTMGLNVMTDIYLGDTTVEALAYVEDPKTSSCRFLERYKASNVPADSPTRGMALLRMSSTQSAENEPSLATPAEQCLATPFVLGNILLFCGDLPVLARVSCVNKVCRDFIASERRLEKFCVRYGKLPSSIRFAYWEKTTQVRKTREASELDYDTYLQMALSKGDATELIMTDVRRTYGRVAPHKRAANHKEEVSDEDLTTQLSEILHALAGRFPAVGYCQGMDYIAAHVLNKVKKSGLAADTKAEAESTFWLLVALFERYGLHDMFAPGLHTLHVHCFQTQKLLELTEPALAEHFALEKVPIEMFAVGWFQTLYLYLNVLPAETLDRIWDIFLYERNWKIMLRVAVALLQLSKEFVMEKPIDEIMQFFNTFADQANDLLAEAPLTQRALRLKVTNTVLTKLQKQHIKAKRATPMKNQTFS